MNEAKKPLEAHSYRQIAVKLFDVAKTAVSSWVDDYAQSMGAALSYYTLFSLGPLVLIVISIAGLVFGQDTARSEILNQLNGLMGKEGASAVADLIKSFDKPSTGFLGALIGFAILILGATSVFGELQDDLDRIWRAPAREKNSGIWSMLRTRLLSFGMVLTIGFLLIVSLVLSAVLAALGRLWSGFFADWAVVATILDFLVSFGITTLGFAVIYKLMPRVSIRWRDVWIGAAVTALLFAIGKSLIGLYIGRSGVVSGYGAASSIVVLLVWVYYSAQIFLFGAEFTWVFAHSFGSRQNIPAKIDATGTVPDRSADGPAPTVASVGRTA